MPPRHPVKTDGERDGDHGGQTFRHGRHRQRHTGLNHHRPWLPLDDAHDGDKTGCRHREPGKTMPERVHPPFERRRLLPDRPRECRDATHFSVATRTDDHRPARTSDHLRALIDHRLAIAEIGLGRKLGVNRFADRHRLTSQRGFDGPEICLFEQSPVRGHRLAGTQFDDIPGHQVGRVDGAQVPLADDQRPRPLQIEQAVHRPHGPNLDDEADSGIEDHDSPDRQRIGVVAQDDRKAGGRNQQQDDDTAELSTQQRPGRDSRGSRNPIRPVQQPPPTGLVIVQARRTRCQRRLRVNRRTRVPRSVQWIHGPPLRT